MKIVILDGYTTNPGDVSWKPIEDIGPCEIFDRTEPEQVYDRCKHADIIITNKVPLEREILSKLPSLKYIGVIATGYNIVDISAAREKGIVVTNVPNYCTASVAQMTFALILEHTRQVRLHSQSVKKGIWTAAKDFCFWDYQQVELTGKTLGVFGLGSIGKSVAQLASGFSMNVIACNTSLQRPEGFAVEMVDQDTLFNNSDIISLHCPLTEKTREIINKSSISLMKRSVIIINTARGHLINEQDLADALNNGDIAGAGLDVLSTEPPEANNPLLNAKNCIITPHIAWASQESRERLIKTTAENIKAFLNNNPVNVVN
jgi:glycerate dehydrogenase